MMARLIARSDRLDSRFDESRWGAPIGAAIVLAGTLTLWAVIAVVFIAVRAI